MTKEFFVGANAPANQDNVHPDLAAVECSNFEGFNPQFIDAVVVRNGNVLPEGTYLFPNGEIIKLTN